MSSVFSNIYYIKNTGSDNNTGLSDAQAWKTISKVNAATLLPGDQILFNRGDSWRNESLSVNYSGTSANNIIVSNYGSGSNP